MRSIGGIDCDEEFRLFLAANPTYTGVPFIPDDEIDLYSQYFICSGEGLRYYRSPRPNCLDDFNNLIGDSSYYVKLTDAGRIFWENSRVDGTTIDELYSAGVSNSVGRLVCGDGTYYVYTRINSSFANNFPQYIQTA